MKNRIRLWPLLVILSGFGLALGWIWLSDADQRQDRVLASVLALVVATLLSLIWLAAFSRLGWRRRLLSLAAVAGVGLLLAFSIRVEGTTGDVAPILGWRFAPRPAPATEADFATESSTVVSAERQIRAEAPYPGFRGPDGDGVIRSGPVPRRDWGAAPPVEVWRVPVGAGWSGFVVEGGDAVTQEQDGAFERVTCFDLASGRRRWSDSAEARFEDPLGGPGPRSTPTIVDGTVYAFGGTGLLRAIDLESGELRWSRDAIAENGGSVPTYGASASPVVIDSVVIVVAGGPGALLAAYDTATGEARWTAGTGAAAYSTPVLATLDGVIQLVVFSEARLAGYPVDGGAALWVHPWTLETQVAAQPQPLAPAGLVIASGYGAGAERIEVRTAADGTQRVESVWSSRALKAKFSDYVLRSGVLYGLDDGILAAVDASTGQRRWKGGRYGHGQLILVDDLLVIQAENGDIALAQASPEGHEELGRREALDGKTWNHPALAGSWLLVRNDRTAVAFRLELESVE